MSTAIEYVTSDLIYIKIPVQNKNISLKIKRKRIQFDTRIIK